MIPSGERALKMWASHSILLEKQWLNLSRGTVSENGRKIFLNQGITQNLCISFKNKIYCTLCLYCMTIEENLENTEGEKKIKVFHPAKTTFLDTMVCLIHLFGMLSFRVPQGPGPCWTWGVHRCPAPCWPAFGAGLWATPCLSVLICKTGIILGAVSGVVRT